VESARVCVIDRSPTIRETVCIILGAEYAVRALTPEAYLHDPSAVDEEDLLIVGTDALPVESATLLPATHRLVWLRTPGAAPPERALSVPSGFRPEQLRAQVRTALAATARRPPVLDGWPLLEYPTVPREVAGLARGAISTRLPVLICGEPGTGKTRIARAIHRAGSSDRFVGLSPATCTRATLQDAAKIGPGSLTVFVHDVSGLSIDGQQLLLDLLDCGGLPSESGWHDIRLICATTLSLAGFSALAAFDKDLFYRLSVLPITLPPLRERHEDIPALAQRFADEISRALSIPPVGFTQRALERLTYYLWFGNLAELETVLTRTVALATRRTIDADDLLFGYGPIVPRPGALTNEPSRQSRPAKDPRSATVDLVINELAHEFKNPMVMIKTLAHHLERMLTDPESRDEVARLTGEAVDRMDRALENLVQFTRFRDPTPRAVPLAALLGPCLSELAPTLTEHSATLDYRPPDRLEVFVDPDQIGYAFENLLHVVVRDLRAGQTLSIRAHSDGALAFEYPNPGRTVTRRLAEYLDSGNGGAESVALGIVLARNLIERNGGQVDIGDHGESASVTVRLPRRAEMAARNGKTANPSR
jgi:signal transduction histidine kinase